MLRVSRFSEVFKALNKTRGLYLRWTELQDDSICITKDEIEWTNTELKNSLRSIEWDLEDLEDTIDILFYHYKTTTLIFIFVLISLTLLTYCREKPLQI